MKVHPGSAASSTSLADNPAPPTLPERTPRLRRGKCSGESSQILGRYASCDSLYGTARNGADGSSL